MSAQDYYNGGSGLGSYQNQSPYPQQRQSQGASSPYQQQQPQYVQQPSDRLYPGSDPNAADGERGIGSTLVGGGAGSYIGHKLGKGTMGTLLGGAVGAVAANFISHKVKGRHGKEEHDGYHSHHGHHGHPVTVDPLPVKGASNLGLDPDIMVIPALAAPMDTTGTTGTIAITSTMDIMDLVKDITHLMGLSKPKVAGTSSITQETTQSAIVTNSSSSFSHYSVPQTDTDRLPIHAHRNAHHVNSFCPTFLLRSSQETESNPSDSSYCFSGQSDNSSNLNITDPIDIMENFDANSLTNAPHGAPKYGATYSSHIGFNGNGNPDTSRIDFTSGTINPFSDSSATVNGAAVEVNIAPRGGSGRGRGTPRGQGRTYRPAKRVRNQREDEFDENDDNDEYINDNRPKKKGKKGHKASPSLEFEDHPAEIHRRKSSLRDRLIKGINEPQLIGMRAYNMKKAAATAAAQAPPVPANTRHHPREFLVPIEPRQDAVMALVQPPYNTANTPERSNNTTGVQPNLHIAYLSTPMHQLHFPEALALALKQSLSRWEAKAHSERSVFVVLRIVASDVADMRVFPSLRQAIGDALYTIISKHPEAFALARYKNDDGSEMKPERSTQASTLIEEITARPAFHQVHRPTNSAHTDSADSADVEEGSLFVIKDEYSEWPQPSRVPDPSPGFNSSGEHLFRDDPEPTYMFWGKYKVSSNGLRMEARRADGSEVKLSVHFKNLRKPVYT
ncbi:hypothetical protein GGR58DRAFT_522537 [Xylaria digitata]|nr:hypothetical protein GGR58DRAFT_522537 [Xylaria digitata]